MIKPGPLDIGRTVGWAANASEGQPDELGTLESVHVPYGYVQFGDNPDLRSARLSDLRWADGRDESLHEAERAKDRKKKPGGGSSQQ